MNIFKYLWNSPIDPLLKDITDAVHRIPKDIEVWDKEIARLIKKYPLKGKGKDSQRALWEIWHMKSFYEGKTLAYAHVIEILNGGRIRLNQSEQKYIRDIFSRVKIQPGVPRKPKLKKLSI